MRILFVTQDAGGCNALLPVILELKKIGKDEVKVVGAKSSVPIYSNNKIEFVDWADLGDERIEREVINFNPDVIVLGTSGGYSLEDKIFVIARTHNYPTISIIDSWMHYASRYRGADKIKDLIHLVTDKVLVNDIYMKEQAISEGIPSYVIEITGNPYLLKLTKKIKIKKYNKTDIFQILYISQPFSELPEFDCKYNELQVLDDLLDCLMEIGVNKKIEILIRPHPRGTVGKFKEFQNKYSQFGLKIDYDLDLYNSINNSDIIFGMNSMVLVESALAGKTVISYQPNISLQDDVMITNRLGLSELITNKGRLKKILEGAISQDYFGGKVNVEKREGLMKELINYDAVSNIIDVIYRM